MALEFASGQTLRGRGPGLAGRLVLEEGPAGPMGDVTPEAEAARDAAQTAADDAAASAAAAEAAIPYGVPTGGVADQVLAKASGADHDVAWVDLPEGGGSAPLAYVTRTSSSSSSYSTTSSSPVDIDSTNLSATVTVPPSGALFLALEATVVTGGQMFWSIRQDGADVPGTGRYVVAGSTSRKRLRVTWRLTGRTPGASVTLRPAFRTDSSSVTIQYGGSSEFSSMSGTHYGSVTFEVWPA